MSALGFLTILAALSLGAAFLCSALLYPIWAAATLRRPALARGSVVVAAIPWIVGVGVLLAALLPGDPHLGQLLSCHCHGSMPGWIHLCPVHPGNALALLPFAAATLAVLLPGRFGAARAALAQPLGRGGEPVVTRLPSPTAVLVGWLRPTLAIDSRLWDVLSASERRALLAHEDAHLRRHDPFVLHLLRVLGILGPQRATSRLIRSWLCRAETSADAVAARQLGDPLLLATALLRCARLRVDTPPRALAWTGGDLADRVQRLMDAPPADIAATPDATFADGAALLLLGLLVAASSPWVHHELEHLLNLSF
ncbi:MAG: M56 family metallopeptidase [Deltaproteobacteria bacterium]|nr:M56 family metallopeptidase [Deltaproteobacteria bacterium]